ncbi:DUF418 domain-containing protein [Parvularcula marina]|uniref:DUF418 domain-containing protein n=1 Tax=Parvularcula marina TaxID=2292771 RepID=A0A371RFH5_9PROT|nr:DUF418 domain-containing protein [Parvularcula marina]RFB04185.1 DUF418 domain-containing protein [Parvularcula marina]
MTDDVRPLTAPTTSSERYAIMDILRGFALFGVLTANLVGLGEAPFMATDAQIEALPTAPIDSFFYFLVDLFIADKANTLFAFLFGVGFWVMMERLESRGAPFMSIYLRRTGILFLFGLIHLFGLFAFDILHLYGAAGFVLLFSRKLPARMMLYIGLALLVFGRPVGEWISEALGFTEAYGIVYNDDAVLARQAAAWAGNYREWIAGMDHMVRYDWFASGLLASWVLYVIGRFYIGAWVARQGWLQHSGDHLPMFRKYLPLLLISGLVLQLLGQLISENTGEEASAALGVLTTIMHAFATPLIAAGYVCGLVLIFNGKSLTWLIRPFAPVGQMALTNYLTQSVLIMLILTNIGPGLGLAGRVGTASYIPIAIGIYAAQAVFSHFWMKAFAYGPAEWLWRTLTYGKAPAIRRRPEALAPAG